MQQTITADEALRAEDSRYAAQMGADFGALERLYDDELVYFHSSGAVDTKASFIELQRSGTVRFRRMTRHEAQVRLYGPLAIITGRGTFEFTARGQDMIVEQLFHAVWIRRTSGLTLVSWQATRAKPA
jgi:hypothetical protein